MRLLALNVATAAIFAFVLPQAPQALARSSDDSSAAQPTQLDGGSGSDDGEPAVGSDQRGPAVGSDNRRQSGSRPEGADLSADTKSKGKRSKRPQKHGTTAFRRLR
jgi:hypothetical protein